MVERIERTKITLIIVERHTGITNTWKNKPIHVPTISNENLEGRTNQPNCSEPTIQTTTCQLFGKTNETTLPASRAKGVAKY